ncbi:hypothetical protein BDN71DRAFT_1435860 [Pleurotus eryngii]|uniref:Uncharacterized protein n=1 Tax=Pleurotus eryngii TaxID=5323 RepID=A0A9P6D1I3_PLEER|nr:hypothetical protein BDN71DRAFT_1435860 [Pleurotus eryngii]
MNNQSESSEPEPEPSKKGKGVDSKNWGALELSQEEADADLQAALQASLKTQHDAIKKGESSGTHLDENKVVLKQELQDLHTELETLKLEKLGKRAECQVSVKSEGKTKVNAAMRTRFGPTPVCHMPVPMSRHDSSLSSEIDSERDILPSAHIAKNLALGVAFQGLQGRKRGLFSSAPSSSSDSSADSNDELSAPMMIKHRKCCGSHSKKTKKHKQKDMKLKPVPPVVYKGKPELVIFQWFVSESISYVEDGNIPRKDKVRIIS